jgi:serine/threonine-protein kinase
MAMGESGKTDPVGVDQTLAEAIAETCARFAEVCRAVPPGAGPPDVGPYVASVAEAARHELDRIAQACRQIPQGGAESATWRQSRAHSSASDGGEPVQLPASEGESAPVPILTIDQVHTAKDVAAVTVTGPDSSARERGPENVDFSLDTSVVQAGGAAWPTVPGYEIVGELGRGGMGVVYKARQQGLNRWVALKVILGGSHAGGERLARFHAEAQAVARLQHPNIVQIHDVGEHDGLPYFSLELVDGGSLEQKVHRRPQPPREAAYLAETLARAIHYAHQHGVVHRDLKPANVLLTQAGLPKITDFGLAKRLEIESSRTQTGVILGTPSYMAPEQARGEVHAIGPAADVYALGAVLYELLTGRPPFQGPTQAHTILQVTRDEPVPPSRWNPGVPRDLQTVCLKCLQKDPGRRYADAAALAEDLRRYLAGEPILARPVGAAGRAWRWCRRNPWLAALSALAAVLLSAWAVTATVFFFRLRDEKAATEREFERAESNFARAEQEARREAAAHKEAGSQRKLALDTLYALIRHVEDKLRDKEGMSALRKEILQTAMDGLQKVSRSAETAAFADRSMGVALQRMGDVYEQLGQTEETMRLYEQSLKIFDRLAAQEPDNDWLPWNSAISFDRLGSLSAQLRGDAAAARDYYERSLRLREGLAANVRTPEIPPGQRRLALTVSYIKLANLTLELGDPGAARAYAQKALQESEGLTAAGLAEPTARQFQAMSCYMLGQAEAHLGSVEEARQQLQRALVLRRRAVQEEPTSAAAKRELGAALDAQGDLEAEQGHAAAALEAYRQANEVYVALCKKEKDNLEDLWYLGHSHYRLAAAYQLAGDTEAAAREGAEALKVREVLVAKDPKNVQFRTELMLARARCGQHAEAARAAAELRREAGKHAGVLFSIARAYALCAAAVGSRKGSASASGSALERQYGEAALDTLRQALGHGYKDREALRRNPDLSAVRGSASFQALLEQRPPP